MTTETFTESAQPAPIGPPIPSGPADAIGWVMRVNYKDVGWLQGVVRDARWQDLEVQWDGECPRKCCLETVKFDVVTKYGEWVGWEPCGDCESGVPKVLCLCQDPIEDEVEAEPVKEDRP